MKYLLDTSSLYPLLIRLRGGILDYSDHLCVLDLTLYEVGNVIWKEYKRGFIKDIESMVDLFEEFLSSVSIMSIRSSLGEILSLAIGEDLTFYDASYLYMSRKLGYKLVTEDSKLGRYPEAIGVDELIRELESLR